MDQEAFIVSLSFEFRMRQAFGVRRLDAAFIFSERRSSARHKKAASSRRTPKA